MPRTISFNRKTTSWRVNGGKYRSPGFRKRVSLGSRKETRTEILGERVDVFGALYLIARDHLASASFSDDDEDDVEKRPTPPPKYFWHEELSRRRAAACETHLSLARYARARTRSNSHQVISPARPSAPERSLRMQF